ncbi:hypothetical protein LTS10_004517 [Elasticomyces elasticus]|nr:hypothetical protein LTS10_004517 [Elasticomyces elasticus]
MAVQQDTAPPLLKLPGELIEAISDDVTAADLRALKLTCRVVSVNIQRAFVRAHFTEQSFILSSPESMQALVDMAKDKVYGKVIRTLNLFALKIPKSPPHPQGRYGRRRAAEGQPDVDRDTRIQKREMGRVYQQTYEKQEKFWKTGRWSVALREALQHIKTSADGISINLVSNKTELQSACGVRTLERVLGQPNCLTDFYLYTAVLLPLLDVISKSGLPLAGFRFEQQQSLTLVGASDWAQQHHIGLFSGLRTVDIGSGTRQSPIELIVTRLGCAQTLEHLIVRVSAWWHGSAAHNLSLETTVELPKLREVNVFGNYPEPRHLAAFCKRYEKTLKRLTLSGTPAGTYPAAQVNREHSRTAVEMAWSAAEIAGIEFELS